MLDRSLNSELVSVDPLGLCRVDDQLPSRIEPHLWGLRLPEAKIERTIQFFQPAVAFVNVPAHSRSIADPEQGRRNVSSCSRTGGLQL